MPAARAASPLGGKGDHALTPDIGCEVGNGMSVFPPALLGLSEPLVPRGSERPGGGVRQVRLQESAHTKFHVAHISETGAGHVHAG